MKNWWVVIVEFASNFFAYKTEETKNNQVLDKEARKIFDMANANIQKEKQELIKAKLDLKTYKKQEKLRKRRQKDIEKAAAEMLGITLREFRRKNKELKRSIAS